MTDDLPMTAKVTRRSKGLYAVTLTFYPSKRKYYADHTIIAKTKKEAKRIARALYSNIRSVK